MLMSPFPKKYSRMEIALSQSIATIWCRPSLCLKCCRTKLKISVSTQTPRSPVPPGPHLSACSGCYTKLTSSGAAVTAVSCPLTLQELVLFKMQHRPRKHRFLYVASYQSAPTKTFTQLFRCYCFTFLSPTKMLQMKQNEKMACKQPV